MGSYSTEIYLRQILKIIVSLLSTTDQIWCIPINKRSFPNSYISHNHNFCFKTIFVPCTICLALERWARMHLHLKYTKAIGSIPRIRSNLCVAEAQKKSFTSCSRARPFAIMMWGRSMLGHWPVTIYVCRPDPPSLLSPGRPRYRD